VSVNLWSSREIFSADDLMYTEYLFSEFLFRLSLPTLVILGGLRLISQTHACLYRPYHHRSGVESVGEGEFHGKEVDWNIFGDKNSKL
jgi:hypothetical protein